MKRWLGRRRPSTAAPHDSARREHVAEIVPGIGQQRERAGEQAEPGFGRDIGEVEGDADREGAAVIERPAHRLMGVCVDGRDGSCASRATATLLRR